MLGGITKAIAEGRSVKEEIKSQSPSKPITSTKTDVFSRVKDNIFGGFGATKETERDKKLFKKMDEVVKLLKSIDRSVSSVDEFIQDQSEGKYPSSSGTGLF
jgi:hypothetical protein